jgi:hypothetical protein
MSGSSTTLQTLRQLLAERFPQAPRTSGGSHPTGVAGIDAVLGGGLPAGRLTELVSARPSSGGQSVLSRLLCETRIARGRVALVDGSDAFDPSAVPPDCLRHLIWVRCGDCSRAFAAADILVRDGNYAVVALDLRGLDECALRRTPPSVWHRLQRAAEAGGAAVLVQTEFSLAPAVPARLVLEEMLPLSAALRTRAEIAAAMEPGQARSPRRLGGREQRAG